VNLHVVDRGSGPVLLLLHGFPLDHTMWNAQIEALSATHRVIAPDLRGFGRSSVTRGTVTMSMMADDLAGLLDAIGVDEPVCLCGLSMGGYVAWEMLRHHADRVGSLVLCDTRAVADTEEAVTGRMAMAARVLTDGTTPVVEAMLPKLFSPATEERCPELVDTVKRTIFFTSPVAIAAAQQGMARRTDATFLFNQITVPTLVVVGEHDSISTVDEMRGIAQQIPGARLVIVPDAGHLSPLENPAAVSAALKDFLGEAGQS